MAAPVYKKFQMFDLENYEENPNTIKNKPPSKEEQASKQEEIVSGYKIPYLKLTECQGMYEIHDYYVISGHVLKEFEKSLEENTYFLFVVSGGSTIVSLNPHKKTFFFDIGNEKGEDYIVTLGKDPIYEERKKPTEGISISPKDEELCIKVFHFKSLIQKQYKDYSRYEKDIILGTNLTEKEIDNDLLLPGTLQVDKLSLFPELIPSAFAISKDLTQIAIGLKNGCILYCRTNNLIDLSIKERLIKYKRLNKDIDKVNEITNLTIFEEEDSNRVSYILYVTTLYEFYKYRISKKDEVLFVISITNGASPGSFDVSERKDFIMGTPGNSKVYKFLYGRDLNEIILPKEFIKLKYVGKQILTIQEGETKKQLDIYDVENSIITYSVTYHNVLSILSKGGKVVILSESPQKVKKIVILKEKDTKEKIKLLINRKMFDIAITFAKNEKFDSEVIAKINQSFAEHLYSKSMHEEAIKKYIETIGFLNPSIVILKYLELQNLDHLITYLEELTKKSQERMDNEEHKYYTALLLNCYVKHKGPDKLMTLINNMKVDSALLDANTAIEVCIESNQPKAALELATKTNNIDQQLRIMIEIQANYNEAINKLNEEKPIEQHVKYLRIHGPCLIKKVETLTYTLIENVAGKILKEKENNSNPHTLAQMNEYIKTLKSIFIDNVECLEKFEDFLIKKDKFLDKEIFNNKIEHLLRRYLKSNEEENQNQRKFLLENGLKDEKVELKGGEALNYSLEVKKNKVNSKELKNQLIQFIRDNKEKFDQNHVLMLFHLYQFHDGVKVLCSDLDLKNELMTFYMQTRDFQLMYHLCTEKGERDPDLWIQALSFMFSSLGQVKDETKGDETISICKKKIEDMLEKIQKVNSISPLLILEMASKAGKVQFRLLKSYFVKKMGTIQQNYTKNLGYSKKYSEEIKSMNDQLVKMKTSAQLYQVKECAECRKKLELPFVHFLCNHSYHEYCLAAEISDLKCTKCSFHFQQIEEKKNQLLVQMEENEQFFKELKEKDRKFDVIAQYFSRGLFQKKEKD